MILKRRILALFLSVGLLGLFSAGARADYTEGYFEYTVGDRCIEITGYFGGETETAVPAQIAGYPVCVIRGGVFAEAETLEVIHLPDCVMEIEEGAFRDGQTVIYADVQKVGLPNSGEPEQTGTAEAEEADAGGTETPAEYGQAEIAETEKPEAPPAEWSVSVTEPLKTDSLPAMSKAEELSSDPGSEELELDNGHTAFENSVAPKDSTPAGNRVEAVTENAEQTKGSAVQPEVSENDEGMEEIAAETTAPLTTAEKQPEAENQEQKKISTRDWVLFEIIVAAMAAAVVLVFWKGRRRKRTGE